MDSNQKRPRVFFGWYIVGACLTIILYTAGIVNFGFTAVFEPIAQEFGWSYAQISLAASLRGLEVGLLAPIMGILVDRWGPRRLVFGGSILVCMGFLLLSRTSSLAMFYGAFALLATGISTCTGTVLMTAVTNWFRRKAGLAIGLVASGFGLGGLVVPILTKMIDVLQWRTAMVVVGLSTLAIVLPLSLIIRHKPEQYGYQPDGEMTSAVETSESEIPAQSGETYVPAKRALGGRTFWHLAISAMLHSFVVGAIMTHLMPYLSSVGISRSLSSLVALTLPVSSIGGRLSSGWLANKLGSRNILTAGFVSMATGMLLFAYVTTESLWLLVPFIITFSLGWGCNVTTRLSLQRQYFGRTNFGTILGFISGIMMLGNMAGAPIAGWSFDTWSTYQGAWLGYGALTFIGALLIITMPSASNTIRHSDQLRT